MNVQVFDSPDKAFMFADFSGQTKGLKFGTNEHGFAECSFFVPMSQRLAFAVYDWPGLPHLVISDKEAGLAFEGRLEDLAIVDGGVQLGALGYWRALSDVPYTALWSNTDVGEWREYTKVEDTAFNENLWQMDTNKRLFITAVKNSTIGNTTLAKRGGLVFDVPHRNQNQMLYVSFDYDFVEPSFSLRAELLSYTVDPDTLAATFVANEWTISATGSGSATLTVNACDRLILSMRRANTDATYTGETGAAYISITNLRITASDGTIYASEIAAALATYINGINGDQLSADSTKIEATSTDLKDELYEDIYPADILDRLALLHNYEVGVWEERRLHFRAKGSVGRRWNVNVTRILELQRSLENVRNSAYAIYKEAGGRTLRTAVADDAASQGRRAIVRRGFVNVTTTDQTEAETHRDAFLSDRKDFAIRARIEFDRLIDAFSQAEYPIWELKAGDTVTMQNLPVGVSGEVDNVRTFLVGRTVATRDDRTGKWNMDLEPETPTPTLVTLIARQELLD